LGNRKGGNGDRIGSNDRMRYEERKRIGNKDESALQHREEKATNTV
jgi:hypothetical protein